MVKKVSGPPSARRQQARTGPGRKPATSSLLRRPGFAMLPVMFRPPPALASLALLVCCLIPPPVAADSPPAALAVTHDEAARTVTVTAGGDVFTVLRYNAFSRPVLWPLRGPGDVPMTRDWPMKPDTPGEDQDHPHHKSVWFTHGDVNGVDFWSESDKAGRVVTIGVPRAAIDADGRARIELENEWRARDGRVVCTDTTVIRCGLAGHARLIDWTITVAASHGPVTFGDTKEGTMAVRTRPELNVDRKNPLAAGSARNREGLTGKALWGAKSAWVDYSAPVAGTVAGLALFDHPSNLRHPTTWHARDYGLVAANPFGLHDFSKDQPKGAGTHVIPDGRTATWRYGIYLYRGAAEATAIDAAWAAWAGR